MWKSILALSLAMTLAPVQAKPVNKTPAKPLPAPEFKYEAALQRVDQKVIKLIGEEKQKTLHDLAVAAVLSDYCPAVVLDKDQFTSTFDALAVSPAKLPAPEQRNLENNLMTYFGVYVGLLIAEGTDRQKAFCAVAENIQREKRPLSRFWLASTAATAAPAVPPAPPKK
jgi:hypothetical protein